VVTAAEMRALDAMAEAAGYGLTEMVEHAGRHLADLCHLLGAWPPRTLRVVILAGAGGNGAGALAAGRHLANAGASVKVVLGQPASEHGPAVSRQLEFLAAARMASAPPGSALPSGADLILDGLVGYGLRGSLRGAKRRLVQEVAAMGARQSALVISLDVPSGLDPDTVRQPDLAIRPAATLAIALPKHGLLDPNAGDIWLADIGIPRSLFAAAGVAEPPTEVAMSGLIPLSRVRGASPQGQ